MTAVCCAPNGQMPPRTPLMTALLSLLQRLLAAEMVVSRNTAQHTKRTTTPTEWHCPLCTFNNPWKDKACSMCAFPST